MRFGLPVTFARSNCSSNSAQAASSHEKGRSPFRIFLVILSSFISGRNRDYLDRTVNRTIFIAGQGQLTWLACLPDMNQSERRCSIQILRLFYQD
jgi:hypothetical protein